MGKYRKIPIEIEAFRIGIDNIPDWFMDKVSTNEIILHGKSTAFEHYNDTHCTIRTLEGNMRAEYGDYVIKGINGEIYPCKPDIFEKTYENIKEQIVSEENIRTIEHLSRYLQLKIDNGEHKIFYNKENHDEKIIDCMYSLEELTNGYLREKERADKLEQYLSKRLVVNKNEEQKEAIKEGKRLIEFWKNYNYATEEGKENCLNSAKQIEILLNYISDLEKEVGLEIHGRNILSNLIEDIKQQIRNLKEEIHNLLDVNGITRAYQLTIDKKFEELLEERK